MLRSSGKSAACEQSLEETHHLFALPNTPHTSFREYSARCCSAKKAGCRCGTSSSCLEGRRRLASGDQSGGVRDASSVRKARRRTVMSISSMTWLGIRIPSILSILEGGETV
eukprot:4897467-Amphidinium_carterae.1